MHGPDEASGHRIRKDVRAPPGGYVCQQAIQVRHPPTQYDDIGIEDIDHTRQRTRQPILVPRETRLGDGVSRGRTRSNLDSRHGIAAVLSVITGESRT